MENRLEGGSWEELTNISEEINRFFFLKKKLVSKAYCSVFKNIFKNDKCLANLFMVKNSEIILLVPEIKRKGYQITKVKKDHKNSTYKTYMSNN